MKLLTPSLIVLICCFTLGCGATRTAGTEGVAKEKLAILHITRQYDVPMVQVSAIRFDNGEKFAIGGDRDFYLHPGVHRVDIDLTTKIETPLKFLSLGESKLEGPQNLRTGELEAGKTYEIRGLAGTVQGMVYGQQMSITQEMATR